MTIPTGSITVLADGSITFVDGLAPLLYGQRLGVLGSVSVGQKMALAQNANADARAVVGYLIANGIGPAAPGGGGTTVGKVASIPAATGSGSIYLCSDLPMAFIDTPGTDAPVWVGFRARAVEPPPLVGTYTTVGNIALTQRGPVIAAAMTRKAGAVGSFALQASALLSAPFVVELEAMWEPMYMMQFPELAVAVATSSVATCISGVQTNGSWGLIDDSWNLGGARIDYPYYSITDEYSSLTMGERTLRLRILSDGVILHMQYSIDGYAWYDRSLRALPGSLVKYGFGFGDQDGSTGYCKAVITKNKISAAQQWAISNATNTSPIVVTAPGNTLQAGDMVAIHAVGGNTAANTGSGAASGNLAGAAWVNVLVPGSTFELCDIAGNGGYTSGGTVTLLSR